MIEKFNVIYMDDNERQERGFVVKGPAFAFAKKIAASTKADAKIERHVKPKGGAMIYGSRWVTSDIWLCKPDGTVMIAPRENVA